MLKYLYHGGAVSSVTLQLATGSLELHLSPGGTIKAPPDNQWVKDQLEMGNLTLVDERPVVEEKAVVSPTETKKGKD